jgi:hypothetical protein
LGSASRGAVEGTAQRWWRVTGIASLPSGAGWRFGRCCRYYGGTLATPTFDFDATDAIPITFQAVAGALEVIGEQMTIGGDAYGSTTNAAPGLVDSNFSADYSGSLLWGRHHQRDRFDDGPADARLARHLRVGVRLFSTRAQF